MRDVTWWVQTMTAEANNPSLAQRQSSAPPARPPEHPAPPRCRDEFGLRERRRLGCAGSVRVSPIYLRMLGNPWLCNQPRTRLPLERDEPVSVGSPDVVPAD